MRVQHNIMAMNSYRNYGNNTKSINKNIEKLSSGYKINRAGDDAAGLAISEKMRAQITGLEGAQKNAKDGISLVQTAEGALTEVHSMLNRMYSLAEQSANGTFESTDRAQLQKEVDKLSTEIDRIADSANFNGLKLLNGSLSATSTSNSTATYNLTGGSASNASEFTAVGDISNAPAALNGATIAYTVNSTTGALTAGAVSASGWTASFTGAAGDTSVTLTLTRTADNTTVTSTLTGGSSPDAAGGTITLGTDPSLSSASYGTAENVVDASITASNLTLQIGDTSDSYNQMTVTINDTHMASLFKGATLADGTANAGKVNISTAADAGAALSQIKNAINYVSDIRGELGATQNRLEHTINNLSVMQENIQDAESTIRDTDVADEMMKYTKNSILVQSAQAMLAQANQQPQGVLQLLQ